MSCQTLLCFGWLMKEHHGRQQQNHPYATSIWATAIMTRITSKECPQKSFYVPEIHHSSRSHQTGRHLCCPLCIVGLEAILDLEMLLAHIENTPNCVNE